ncbi:MAG: tetratricopeptide repeat protein [Candidatus Hydrogenedentes bacterium]|nr:tetratricopeptide repeat protein [Candidatus Hydrogenedentota bacterium]
MITARKEVGHSCPTKGARYAIGRTQACAPNKHARTLVPWDRAARLGLTVAPVGFLDTVKAKTSNLRWPGHSQDLRSFSETKALRLEASTPQAECQTYRGPHDPSAFYVGQECPTSFFSPSNFKLQTSNFLLIAILALGAVWVSPVTAAGLEHETQVRLLNEATEAFREGNRLVGTDKEAAQTHYEKAVLRLERIVREGGIENGKLYYNLGNIWYQRGDLGRAMLNYLRAEQYIPNDIQLHQNLAFVRQQRTDAFQESEKRKVLKTLFFWHYDLASQTRLTLFSAFFLLLWILATARLFWKRRELTAGIAVCAALSGLLFLSLTVEASQYQNNPRGVVLAAECVARKGDGESYQPSFSEPLHAGTEFTLRDDRGSWVFVTLNDDRTCWLQRSDIALVQDKLGSETAS